MSVIRTNSLEDSSMDYEHKDVPVPTLQAIRRQCRINFDICLIFLKEEDYVASIGIFSFVLTVSNNVLLFVLTYPAWNEMGMIDYQTSISLMIYSRYTCNLGEKLRISQVQVLVVVQSGSVSYLA